MLRFIPPARTCDESTYHQDSQTVLPLGADVRNAKTASLHLIAVVITSPLTVLLDFRNLEGWAHSELRC
jgi:hypothetical protein